MLNIKETQSKKLSEAFNSGKKLRHITLGNRDTTPSTIVFIDSAVDDYQSLVDGAIPEAEVIVLDSTQDGVAQITEVLQGRTNIAAIHIVSHGSPGCLYLGNTQLSLDTLEHYATQLQTWTTLLTSSSLLLYGCNVAAGDAGEEFVAQLRQLTGANIAASANRTGSAELGGDWELEVTTGKVELPLAFSVEVREAYASVLADVNLSGTILWTDEGGNTHPVREATVEIWDSDDFPLFDELVTTVRTDVNGKYSSTLNNNDGIFQGNRDIYIKVLADSPFHYVSSDGTEGETYSQRNQITFNEIPNGAQTIDLTIGNTTNAERAFSVNDALYTSGLYAKTVRGEEPQQKLSARFPGDLTFSYYQNNRINLVSGDWQDWDVIQHEYGHFLAEKDGLAKLPLPGGPHFFGVSNIPTVGKENGVQLAWSEGIADYLGIAAQNVANAAGGLPSVFNQNGTSSTGDTFYTDPELSLNVDLETITGSGNAGEGDEVSVMRILWDIADNNQDTFTNRLIDHIALGHKELYDILNNNIANLDQLDDVWDYFYGISDDATRVNYGAIFQEYGVSPVPFGEPINQTLQLGSAIPTFQWSRNNNNANDQFQAIVFNNDFSKRELDYLVPADVTQWTPDPDQWNQIIDTPGEYHFVIAGSDTDNPTTGSYWSGAYNFFVTPPSQILVTTPEDVDDGNLSPNDISLREAIRFVNPGGTINFDPSLTGGTITLSEGEVVINKDLIINGLGANNLTISGNNASPVFEIDDGNDSNLINVEIEGLTITNGFGNFGGGISNNENLTIADSTITGNTGTDGGGITNKGTLTITNTTISNNSAGGRSFGGGINNSGTLKVTDSTISGNTAGVGGGIASGINGTVEVINSTISDNSSTLIGVSSFDGGGGISSSGGILTVTNSTISGNTAVAEGGGIRNSGTLTVSSSTISGNRVTATRSEIPDETIVIGEGGGIFNDNSSTATLTNTIISDNTASISGGGVSNRGTLTVTNSTISGENTATDEGGGIFNTVGTDQNGVKTQGTATVTSSTISGNRANDGGGMSNEGGMLTVTSSTISDNTANDDAGGIQNSLQGTLTVTNSTISGNTANDDGGGIEHESGTLTVTNSTITNNTAGASSSFDRANGGGISSAAGGTIKNTIIAGNIDSNSNSGEIHPDVSGTFTTTDSNLIGDGTGSNFTNSVNGNIVGTSTNPIDPKLGPLQDNGGPTFTHALLPGSPAINAGNNANIPAGIDTDQRGEPRIVGDTVDIGAFEAASTPVVLPLIVTPNDDTVTGTPGNDTVISGGGQDQIFGGSGNDSLDGGDGDDRLSGGEGNDTLLGGQGQDRLSGDSGDDLLNGGAGDNTLTGGAGKDIFVLSTAGKNNIVDFVDGQDLLKLEGGLTFGQLSIFEQNGDTWITTNTNQPLAFLTGVNSNLITTVDFTV
jgi:hypothetical protein